VVAVAAAIEGRSGGNPGGGGRYSGEKKEFIMA